MSEISKAWPSDQEINEAHDAGLGPRSQSLDRNWSCFDLSVCKHPLMVGVTPLGVGQPDWFVEICSYCGHTESQCLHNEYEWNEAGTLLRCTTCGGDGT